MHHFPALTRLLLAAVAAAAPSACVAQAQEPPSDMDAYRSHLAALSQPAGVDEAEACPDGTIEWRRGVDVDFCAAVCSSDADCERGIERCRLLDPEAGPTDPAILV